MRISPDNTAIDNWHDGTKVGGMWTNYQNDIILDDHLDKGQRVACGGAGDHEERRYRNDGCPSDVSDAVRPY